MGILHTIKSTTWVYIDIYSRGNVVELINIYPLMDANGQWLAGAVGKTNSVV